MFVAHEQKLHRYFFFLQGSHIAGKNEFVSPYTCLQSYFSLKYNNNTTIIQLSLAAFSYKQ